MERIELSSSSRVCPCLITIYLNNFFVLSEFADACNFADNNNFLSLWYGLKSFYKRLEHDSFMAIEWIENNIK